MKIISSLKSLAVYSVIEQVSAAEFLNRKLSVKNARTHTVIIVIHTYIHLCVHDSILHKYLQRSFKIFYKINP